MRQILNVVIFGMGLTHRLGGGGDIFSRNHNHYNHNHHHHNHNHHNHSKEVRR